jgi:hypothetical protein
LVGESTDGWTLYGTPVMLLDGKFKFESFLAEQIASIHAKSSYHNMVAQNQENQPPSNGMSKLLNLIAIKETTKSGLNDLSNDL